MTTPRHLQIVGPANGRIQARDTVGGIASDRGLPRSVWLCGADLAVDASFYVILREHGYRVYKCGRFRTQAAEFEACCDVALFVVSNNSGAEPISDIQALEPRTRQRVLLVTWASALDPIRVFIDSGIGDFVKMPAPISELLLRIRLLSIKAAWQPPPSAAPPRARVSREWIAGASLAVRLSDRESLLFRVLAERMGSVVTRGELLRLVWKRDITMDAATNIVDVYIRYLRVKLANAAPSLRIETVRSVGYVLAYSDDVQEDT